MTQTAQDVELDEAIAAAELDDDEAAKVRELVAGGGMIAPAIEHVLAARELDDDGSHVDQPPPPPAAPAFAVDTKKVETEIERHLQRMAELLGPTAEEYEPCEECGAVGLRIIRETMKAHEMYRACPTCGGHGQVLTGSKDPSYRTQGCPDCAARGFQTKAVTLGTPPPAGETVVDHGDGYGTEAWMGNPNLTPKPAGTEWQ